MCSCLFQGTEGAPVFDKHAHLCGLLAKPLRQKDSGVEIQVFSEYISSP